MGSFTGIKLAIWDLDGTIIDSYGIFAAVVTEAAQLGGHRIPSSETIKKNFHGTLEETIGAILQLVDDPVNLEIVMNDFLRLQDEYYKNPDEHVFKDAQKLSKQLHESGTKQIIVTNRAHASRGSASPRYLIDNSSLKPYFEAIVCADDSEFRKPDAAVLNDVAVAQSVRAEEMIVIGDQYVDAKLAQNLNARAILVSRHPEPIPHLNDLGDDISFLKIVSTLDELQ